MAVFLVFLLAVAYVNAVQYVVNPDENKEFEGVGIGLVTRPTYCDKTTKKGDLMRVNFNGTLGDGTAFEEKYNDKIFEFVLGEGQVISGWEAGLQDMCVGEVRHLTVPPQYAYGENGMGGMPSRVTLYFFVKLISFETVPDAPRKINTFRIIDVNHDGLLSRDEVKDYLSTSGVKDVAGSAGISQMLRDIFREEDRDANGFITHVEFSGRKHTEL